jgi:uncharacterized protein YjbJ (UPF0337 family)
VNWDQIEAKWAELGARVHDTWTRLTDEDLARIAGQRDRLLATIQNRYAVTKDQAEREVDLFERGLESDAHKG